MTVVSARIGTLGAIPTTERHRRTWLSFADLTRLIEATATTTAGGHHIVYAISANRRRRCPLEPGNAIGYFPQDDAEEWAPFEAGRSGSGCRSPRWHGSRPRSPPWRESVRLD
ncbi:MULTISPECIES: hypothetical protein [Microbacterium]|uniref:hypothetical protein n=1 Tax=Microbacterium TaxID=33882 RepID=UPI000D644EB8|nr:MULTISPECIES: hypothetical protein [Microbacterium]